MRLAQVVSSQAAQQVPICAHLRPTLCEPSLPAPGVQLPMPMAKPWAVPQTLSKTRRMARADKDRGEGAQSGLPPKMRLRGLEDSSPSGLEAFCSTPNPQGHLHEFIVYLFTYPSSITCIYLTVNYYHYLLGISQLSFNTNTHA